MKNDRFKFRAYDPAKKEYYDEFYLMSNGDGAIYSPVEETGNEDRLIIEQCTGLRDKNGKLAYEGDIVRYDVDSQRMGRIAAVKFKDAHFFFESNGRDRFGLLQVWNVEIIGNIHENPELLEGIE